jgi:uncharacterized protein YehS (DUF1456 family)
MRNTEDVNEDSTHEWLQCDACEAGFQHVTDIYIVSGAIKQEEGKGRATAIRIKEEKVPTVSVTGRW